MKLYGDITKLHGYVSHVAEMYSMKIHTVLIADADWSGMNTGNMICNNCAWYCHADGKCYGSCADGCAALPELNTGICLNWTFDGLEEWEREPETLVTMEKTCL